MTKKSTTKEKSPAPATATKTPRKKASKNSVAKATPAAVPLTGAPAANPVPLPVTIKATQTAPTILSTPSAAPVKAVAPAKVQTKIIVRADVGYGNALYLRGDGPGLSWNEGVAMECVAADQWEYTLGESSRPVSFKVLINDQLWASGPDAVVASGSTTTITPEFA